MKTSKIFAIAILAISTFSVTSCSDDDGGEDIIQPEQKSAMNIEFEHVWGDSEDHFHLGDAYTHPITGEEITFTTLRYYVSNVQLTKIDGTVFSAPDAYFMLDADHDGLHEITITDVPTGDYSAVSFMVGVDSLRNVSGAQEGALSPSENMFWSWNSGYIFVKAEGTSPAAENNSFAYHLGGYMGGNSAQRTHLLDFDGSLLEVTPNAIPTVHLIVNADSFWDNGNNLATLSNMTMPGAMASMLASNFATGFRFDHVHN